MTFIGTAVSAYLTWVHYSGSLALCVGVGGCEVVQASRYSMAGPVPVALLGLAGCAAMLAVSLARLRAASPWLDLALFMLSLSATLFTAYLTYIEIFVLGAICPWCVTVAICCTATLGLSAVEIASADRSPASSRPRRA